MRRKCTIFVVCCLLSLTAQAQEDPWLLRTIKAVGRYIDSSAVKGIDQRYITVPKRPWQVVLKYNVNQMNLKMTSHQSIGDQFLFDFTSKANTRTANSLGLWVGYRGYGIGYSIGLRKQTGMYFTTGVTGSSYGLNLRLRTYKSFDPSAEGSGYITTSDGSKVDLGNSYTWLLEQPIRVRTMIIDGYYMFNSKRFSYMAAYDQSALQIKSAGSFMAGAMYHATTIAYDNLENAGFITFMDDIGKLRIRQASVGFGYAYNWVPVKGLLVSAFAMPMLTFYNRQKVDFYDVKYDEETGELKELSLRESKAINSDMMLNFNARLSLTYNFERISLNIYGQWNQFRYDHDNAGSGLVNDWFVNGQIGYRF